MNLTPIVNPVALRLDTTVGTRIFAGDTMIHGDTGGRDISDSLDTAWGLHNTYPYAIIRRENQLVTFEARLKRLEAGPRTTREPIVTLPAGFRPRGYSVLGGTADLYGTTMTGTLNSHDGATLLSLGALTGSWTAGDSLFVYAQWRTDDNWPIILPGLPA